MINKQDFDTAIFRLDFKNSDGQVIDDKRPDNFQIYHHNDLNDQQNNLPKSLIADHFKVILIVEGSTQIQLDHIVYDLPLNSLLIMSPDVSYKYYPTVKGSVIPGMEFSLAFLISAGIHIEHEEMFAFMSSNKSPYFLLEKEETERLAMLMEMIKHKHMSEGKHYYKKEVLHLGFNLFMFELASILKMHNLETPIAYTRKQGILTIFLKLLDSHFREERSVQYYADQMYITSKHLTKTVKELTNKTCSALIDEIVIKESKFLLDDLSIPVGRVAEKLHFSDQFFFSKFFKNQTGTNPSQYKKSLCEAGFKDLVYING
jgi:AraC family transcriptional regulator, transcriptional activator of pobA